MRGLLVASALLPLAACAADDEHPVSPVPPSNCPVIESRNWHAWIDKAPGPTALAALNITGEVDMPTPGYTIAIEEGPTDRAQPPGQRFRLTATPPDGMVAQVVTPTQVSYSAGTKFLKLREVIIGCGDKVLGRIPDVSVDD